MNSNVMNSKIISNICNLISHINTRPPNMTHKFPTSLQICLLLVAALQAVVAQPNQTNTAKPNCPQSCGNVAIPFPFGIGAGCFHDHWFEIECRPSPSNHSKPFLSKLPDIEIVSVDLSFHQSMRVNLPPLKVCGADTKWQQQRQLNLTGSPYSFSGLDNVLLMTGCPGSAVLINESSSIVAGCATACNADITVPAQGCRGVNCCQTKLPKNDDHPYYFQFYQIDFSSLQAFGEPQQNCITATLIETDSAYQYLQNRSSSDLPSAVPVEMKWGWNQWITAPDCEGCQGECLNKFVLLGTEYRQKFYCKKKPPISNDALIGLGSGFGLLLLLSCLYGLYRFIKSSIEKKRRGKFFKRNGGLLLQQQLSSNEGVVETMKIFTIRELNKATNNFNKNQILGQGGQGTVYKGILTDGSTVAVKKSKLVDESQLGSFINEVFILSGISHRNVVKLFGCCLEAEVPLLVYEFISNGMLYEHIHAPEEDFFISWEMRLKIAADSAGAIAYLHSSSSNPICHRDIKSQNILLDEKHKAKVSDFGLSKTLAIDQTHLTTDAVQGTAGYLDPEFFQTCQFTEKSDVYSFGVVLLELLTSKKPIFTDAGDVDQQNLVTTFQFLTCNSRLAEILDPEIVKQTKEDELMSVVELAKRCVSLSGRLRPSMKDVAIILERIIKSPAQVSAWYQQQEDIPIQFAAYDAFDLTAINHPDDACDENPLLHDAI